MVTVEEVILPQYASFGSVLCAMDVNGDGWSDLLVGAPTYIADANDDIRSYDEGRVFVFISDGEVKNGKVCGFSSSPLILLCCFIVCRFYCSS